MGNSAGRKGDPSSVDADFARRVGLAFYTEEHSHVDHVNIFEHVTSHRSRGTRHESSLFFVCTGLASKKHTSDRLKDAKDNEKCEKCEVKDEG